MEQSGVAGLTIEGQAERIVSFREAPFCTQLVLAEMMGVQIGDTVDLKVRMKARAQTDEDTEGSVNLLDYRVDGIVQTRNIAIDSVAIWITLDEADALLGTDGERSHVAVRLSSRRDADSFSQRDDLGGWQSSTAAE